MLNLIYVCVTQQHDVRLVALAAVVCLFTCLTATNLVARAADPRQSRRTLWTGAASVVFGCGVWTTHFVAELAYRPGVPVGYDVNLTALSALIAVLMSWIGIAFAMHYRKPVIGGGIVGGAIGAMHYVGIAAIHIPGEFYWNASFVAVSLAIGVLLAAAAFAVQTRAPELRRRLAAAGLLVLAICGLHFTGMAALSVGFDPTVEIPSTAIAPEMLAIAIACVTVVIITIALAASVADDQLTKRAVAEAARLQRMVEERTVELHQAQAELLHNERLSTIGQLTASFAHELRNPLSAVRNSLFVMRELAKTNGLDFERQISRAERGIGRCTRIIDDVLDYAHVRELKCLRVSVEAWMEEVLAEQKLPPHVRLVRDYGGGWDVFWDPERMRRVIAILVENATQALSECEGERHIVVATRATGDIFELTVTDDGIGIAPEILSRVFEPLYSTKSFGTGLGLPSAQQIVEQHGGRISIESTLNRGTKATIRMSCVAAARAAA